MPYFSFSVTKSILQQNFILNDPHLFKIIQNAQSNKKYYSKYYEIFKTFKNNINSSKIISLKKEQNNKYLFSNKNIIFFLPPNYGLGDVIEYGLAVKKIQEKFTNMKIGFAFVYKYKKILEDLIKLENVYEYFISKEELDQYESHFHFTFEIDELKFQKYNRQDIEKKILGKFNIKDRHKILFDSKKYHKTIKKISIYPFSASPIRSLSPNNMISIIEAFGEDFTIEIIMDNFSTFIKNYKILNHYKKTKFIYPMNTNELLKTIKKTQFGIFVDSGPLHLAKLFNLRGVLIESTVSSKYLVQGHHKIKIFKNNYKSNYCNGPCGLTNLINLNGSYGCYENLKINFNNIKKMHNLKSLQRGLVKKKYDHFIKNPVGCIKNINDNLLLSFIRKQIKDT